MSLCNFHVDANVTLSDRISRIEGTWKQLQGIFKQAVANGNFTLGPVKFHDGDLNRIHGIVMEIDGRRVFYNCGEDEIPKYAMKSLYEAKNIINETRKGVWANPTAEMLVSKIVDILNKSCTEAEALMEKGVDFKDGFMDVMFNMRSEVWLVVAALKKKVGSSIVVSNLPLELEILVKESAI